MSKFVLYKFLIFSQESEPNPYIFEHISELKKKSLNQIALFLVNF